MQAVLGIFGLTYSLAVTMLTSPFRTNGASQLPDVVVDSRIRLVLDHFTYPPQLHPTARLILVI